MSDETDRGDHLPADLWARMLDDVSPHLTSKQRALTALVRPIGIRADTVTVAVPNAFTRNEVDRLLREPLAEALGNRLGRSVRLGFVLDGDPSGGEHHAAPDVDPVGHGHRSGGPAPAATEAPSNAAAPEPRVPARQAHLAVVGDEPPPRVDRQDAVPVQPVRAATPGTDIPEARGTAEPSNLNARYTFDTFVVGSSNRFAHAAAFAVAEAPAEPYNPLFIHGDSGLGKTHLLHAIGHYVLRLYPSLRVRYVSTEDFTNDFINSVKDGRAEGFRRRYRDVDVLLIDDIQFIEKKEGTQEEFFHTFNTLHTNGKQLVITSDRPPKQLVTLEDRLRTRFAWGLITDITPPDLETRIAILRKKAAQERIVASDDVLEAIATRVQRNIRELEGALIRVSAYASLDKRPIDLDVADVVLGDLAPDDAAPPLTLDRIRSVTAIHFGFTVDDLCGASRNRTLTNARQIAMYLCRELTDLSLPKIGEGFGGRDHTTVLHAERKIREQMKGRRATYEQVTLLTKKLQGRDW